MHPIFGLSIFNLQGHQGPSTKGRDQRRHLILSFQYPDRLRQVPPLFYVFSTDFPQFAAHPILVPLYLAQYHINEAEPEAGSVTVFTEGFGAVRINARFACMDQLTRVVFVQGYPMVANFSTQVPADEVDPMIAATQFMGVDTSKQVFGMNTNVKRVEFAASYGGAEFDEALSEYLDEAYDKAGSISELASYGYLQNDNDPRIRPYTPEEAEAILEYLKPGLAGIVSIKINNSLQVGLFLYSLWSC